MPGIKFEKNMLILMAHPGNGPPKPMNQNLINKSLQRIWKINSGNPINASLLRKSISTKVRKQAPWCRESLARQMNHKPRTADEYYQIYDIRQSALSVTKLIETVMEKSSVKVCVQNHFFEI